VSQNEKAASCIDTRCGFGLKGLFSKT